MSDPNDRRVMGRDLAEMLRRNRPGSTEYGLNDDIFYMRKSRKRKTSQVLLPYRVLSFNQNGFTLFGGDRPYEQLPIPAFPSETAISHNDQLDRGIFRIPYEGIGTLSIVGESKDAWIFTWVENRSGALWARTTGRQEAETLYSNQDTFEHLWFGSSGYLSNLMRSRPQALLKESYAFPIEYTAGLVNSSSGLDQSLEALSGVNADPMLNITIYGPDSWTGTKPYDGTEASPSGPQYVSGSHTQTTNRISSLGSEFAAHSVSTTRSRSGAYNIAHENFARYCRSYDTPPTEYHPDATVTDGTNEYFGGDLGPETATRYTSTLNHTDSYSSQKKLNFVEVKTFSNGSVTQMPVTYTFDHSQTFTEDWTSTAPDSTYQITACVRQGIIGTVGTGKCSFRADVPTPDSVEVIGSGTISGTETYAADAPIGHDLTHPISATCTVNGTYALEADQTFVASGLIVASNTPENTRTMTYDETLVNTVSAIAGDHGPIQDETGTSALFELVERTVTQTLDLDMDFNGLNADQGGGLGQYPKQVVTRDLGLDILVPTAHANPVNLLSPVSVNATTTSTGTHTLSMQATHKTIYKDASRTLDFGKIAQQLIIDVRPQSFFPTTSPFWSLNTDLSFVESGTLISGSMRPSAGFTALWQGLPQGYQASITHPLPLPNDKTHFFSHTGNETYTDLTTGIGALIGQTVFFIRGPGRSNHQSTADLDVIPCRLDSLSTITYDEYRDFVGSTQDLYLPEHTYGPQLRMRGLYGDVGGGYYPPRAEVLGLSGFTLTALSAPLKIQPHAVPFLNRTGIEYAILSVTHASNLRQLFQADDRRFSRVSIYKSNQSGILWDIYGTPIKVVHTTATGMVDRAYNPNDIERCYHLRLYEDGRLEWLYRNPGRGSFNDADYQVSDPNPFFSIFKYIPLS